MGHTVFGVKVVIACGSLGLYTPRLICACGSSINANYFFFVVSAVLFLTKTSTTLADANFTDSERIFLDFTQELAPAHDLLSFELQTKVQEVRKNLSRTL